MSSGYERVQRDAVTGRALEARALTRSALALRQAFDARDDEQLVMACTMNVRLWLFFYSEIEANNVTLPPEVASNIVSLAAYVAKVTPRAMAGEAKVIETLVSINRNIAAGLSEGADEAPHPAAAAAAPAVAALTTSA